MSVNCQACHTYLTAFHISSEKLEDEDHEIKVTYDNLYSPEYKTGSK